MSQPISDQTDTAQLSEPAVSKPASALPQEIERKWQLRQLPAGCATAICQTIRQGYITEPESDTEVRVRQIAEQHWLTVKRGEGMCRHEVETKISIEQFEQLWSLTDKYRVEKQRYFLKHEGTCWEIDVYHGTLAGFIIAEVEFESVAQAEQFQCPWPDAEELSETFNFKNMAQQILGK